MAATPKEVLRQIDAAEPAIVSAFLEEVARIVDDAKLAETTELVSTGQIDRIAVVLGVDAPAFTLLLEAVRQVYLDGGLFEVGQIPLLDRPGGGRFRLRFDIRNLRAESWLREESSRLVTAITEDARVSIREVVAEGTRLGRNPRDTALDIVGRVNRETGRRLGGIIGLTDQQTRFTLNARAELLSGDPAVMRRYFERQRRDARFDRIVQKAISEKRAVAAADVDRIVARYADRLLKLRGDNIARTEALTAFSAAREEAYAQAVDSGVRPELITGTWRTAGDGRVRDAHRAMAGQRRPWGQPFQSPTGALMLHPGDTSLGAGPADVVNCRCVKVVKIDHLAEALSG